MFLQPHVAYYSICQTVDGTHFVRNLITGLIGLI